MRKLLLLAVAFAVSMPVFAVTTVSKTKGGFIEDTKTDGAYVSRKINGALSYKASTEVAATDDTLTAAESGKELVVTSNAAFTLPPAADGLKYTFIAGDAATINVDPQATDTIAYLTLDAGDKITSGGATADSVSVLGDGDNSKWYVSSINGTWTDGGA